MLASLKEAQDAPPERSNAFVMPERRETPTAASITVLVRQMANHILKRL
jgi:hypothetical protein